MSPTRRVLLGIAAAGLVSATTGCATVVDAIGYGAVMASGYEMVPGSGYVGPPVVARWNLFDSSSGEECGLGVEHLSLPDGGVMPPSAAGGPGVGLGQTGIGVIAPPGIGVRLPPVELLRQPLPAAWLTGGPIVWRVGYARCLDQSETPR
jgi:hypothetical protein